MNEQDFDHRRVSYKLKLGLGISIYERVRGVVFIGSSLIYIKCILIIYMLNEMITLENRNKSIRENVRSLYFIREGY